MSRGARGAACRADGLPETPADTRFFNLRASGYVGPVDQDGYPVADGDEWIERRRPVSNPGPAVNPAKNPRRGGISNHHLDTSGGESMLATIRVPDPAVAAVDVEAIIGRLLREQARFLRPTSDEQVAYSPSALAEVVVEILADHTADLACERAAAEDAVVELLHDLEGGAQ